MKKVILIGLAAAACSGGERQLTTFRDSSSYAIGLSIGGSVANVRDSVDLETLIQGIRDAADDREQQLSQADVERVMQRFAREAQTAQLERSMAEGRSNRNRGDTYRALELRRADRKTGGRNLVRQCPLWFQLCGGRCLRTLVRPGRR